MSATTNRPATIVWTLFDSPIGPLLAAVSPRGLCALEFDGAKSARTVTRRLARHFDGAVIERVEPRFKALAPVRTWLDRYFDGDAPDGRALALDLRGTEFERAVWKMLLAIPLGQTWTYGALAERIGHPGSARAVGGAVGSNPVAVVVPCHRVVGANGSLTGFGGGIPRKRWLLAHEAAVPETAPARGSRSARGVEAGRGTRRQLALDLR